MSEQHQSSRQPQDPFAPGARKSDSQLRLVRMDEEAIIPDHAEPTDDSPTIISKKASAEALQKLSQHEVLGGANLRGQRLAHFELIEPIGVGGMAAVIRARDTQLDRFVALKILPPEMSADIENVRRFHQEARAAAKLDHENIARVFLCGEDKKLHFIAFEYVEGENLRTLLERRGKLPVPEAVRYILQIATGLEHASSRGVVHRDIKPSNIIISPNGRAKLVDMGLARSLAPHGDKALTQSGVTLGTFDYISPEQALEPREADSRSDIYSLGCTFYHMLTGQPPVPDGTALKKLHHHQHVAPIDPRQLNPEIPDEVAAILMRMMAKDAKDRYQRPVHLVQHLIQVAQKVGAGADVPEGIMFLDAPLPGAPRMRPLLTVAATALALGVLLVLVSMAPNNPKTGGGIPDVAIAKGDGNKAPVDNNAGSKPIEPTSLPTSVSTLQHLARVLEDKNRRDEPVNLEEDIFLGENGLRFQGAGPKLVLRSLFPKRPVTLRFQYQPGRELSAEATELLAGLIVDGGEVEFRDIRFELQSTVTPETPVAMVAVRGTGKASFVGCTFTQKDNAFRSLIRKNLVPLASVLLVNAGGDAVKRPQVNFDKCYWEQGEAAVALQGLGKLLAKNCSFGPHAALFHLRGDTAGQLSELSLSRCSAFVVQGPAFRVDGAHHCKLQVIHSIFSSPENPDSNRDRDEIQLVRQTDAKDPLVRYQGQRNCYHNLQDGLWVGENGFNLKTTLEDFKSHVERNGGYDTDSSVLAVSPWAITDPLQKGLQPDQAYLLKSGLRELRIPPDYGKAIGVEAGPWGTLKPLPPWPATIPPVTVVKTKPNEKIIDPDAADNTPGVYQSLGQALEFSKPGDVLLLKHGKKTRDVEIRADLQANDLSDLTIKPYPDPGNHPVLVLAEKTRDRDAALFRVFDGKLHFENLEFHLEPEQQDFKAQSIVVLAGNGLVSFKNCAITLKQPERRMPLSVVTFPDPDVVMKMPMMMTSRSLAQVEMSGSLVRGEGDLVSVRGSRPFELKIDNSLLALAGSVLLVQGGGKDLAVDMPTVVKMTRVSAFLTEPAISLRGGKTPRSLGLIRCEPVRDCMFVGLGDRPLVVLENLESGEDALKQYLDWKGEKNAYVNLDKRTLELNRPGETFPSLTLDAEAWQRWETDGRFLKARMPFNKMPPLSLRSLSNMELEHFKANAELQEELAPFGANLDARILPRFSAPRKLEIVNTGY